MDLRRDLSEELTELTRRSYLLAVATEAIRALPPAVIVERVATAVTALSADGRSVHQESAEMTVEQIETAKAGFTSFATDLLLVELQALLHTHLMLASGKSIHDQAIQIEALLGGLWPASSRGTSSWAFKDVVLLTELRNAIMHSRGVLDRTGRRLEQAGWSDEELENLALLERRSFSDFLRFKRAVRTVANEALKGSHETGQKTSA